MIDAVCVIGHPSRLGGADTELDHQIHCWQAMGSDVHICYAAPLDDNLRAMNLRERGCIYHEPYDWPSLDGSGKQGQALVWQRRRNKGLLTGRGSLPRHWGIGGMSPGC